MSDDLSDGRVRTQLTAAVSPFVSTLASIGIERSTTGELSIDSDMLTEVLTDGRFARASSPCIGPASLANATERISRDLLDAKIEFLTHSAPPAAPAFSYTRPNDRLR